MAYMGHMCDDGLLLLLEPVLTGLHWPVGCSLDADPSRYGYRFFHPLFLHPHPPWPHTPPTWAAKLSRRLELHTEDVQPYCAWRIGLGFSLELEGQEFMSIKPGFVAGSFLSPSHSRHQVT
jgi:hypothetical protein